MKDSSKLHTGKFFRWYAVPAPFLLQKVNYVKIVKHKLKVPLPSSWEHRYCTHIPIWRAIDIDKIN
jgi:hypothetical protein